MSDDIVRTDATAPPNEIVQQNVNTHTDTTKRISWPAVFGGVLVALGLEVLFTAFGLFIGFRIHSLGGIDTWSTVWYLVTSFCSLFFGGMVAARLSNAYSGSGALHGLVTWGLSTVATFAFLAALSWGVLSQGILMARTATIAAAEGAPAAAQSMTPGEANRVQQDVNQAEQQAPEVAATIRNNVSLVSLVVFIGAVLALCGSMVGGAIGQKPVRIMGRTV